MVQWSYQLHFTARLCVRSVGPPGPASPKGHPSHIPREKPRPLRYRETGCSITTVCFSIDCVLDSCLRSDEALIKTWCLMLLDSEARHIDFSRAF